jgi:hypothetical protein
LGHVFTDAERYACSELRSVSALTRGCRRPILPAGQKFLRRGAGVTDLPEAGSVLDWVATVTIPVMEGQGIAWDRSSKDRLLWGITKKDRKVLQVLMPRLQVR